VTITNETNIYYLTQEDSMGQAEAQQYVKAKWQRGCFARVRRHFVSSTYANDEPDRIEDMVYRKTNVQDKN
jgi:hypothetical protein